MKISKNDYKKGNGSEIIISNYCVHQKKIKREILFCPLSDDNNAWVRTV